MTFQTLSFIFQWWLYTFIIGISFLPLSKLFFKNFLDSGYIFSKTIGILIISYLVFLLGALHTLSFTRANIIIILAASAISIYFTSAYVINKNGKKINSLICELRSKFKIIILEEIIFLYAFVFWTSIREFQPDIHGIEKFMDFSFVNSILRTEYFPAKDPWFSPLTINYYYFGHVYSAVLIKLSNIPSNLSFNLVLGTIFALIFLSVFSISTTLLNNLLKEKKIKLGFLNWTKIIIGGLISSLMVSMAGNLQIIYAFFKPIESNVIPFWKATFSPLTFPNSYWYPSATRFVYHTIHEFPAYSIILSDLHAHLLDTPFVLLALGLILVILMKTKNLVASNNFAVIDTFDGIFISLIIAILYMTNAWDSAIYFGILSIIIFYIIFKKKSDIKNKVTKFFNYFLFVFISSLVFSLPFSLNFRPFVAGIGFNCSPAFLTNIGRIGPFLFESGFCQKTPFWQLMILYGVFVFFCVSFLLYIRRLKTKLESDKFTLLLFLGGFSLILIPEFIYLKDIYPTYFRANTMFKIAYAAFIILSIASSYGLFRILYSTRFQIKNLQKFFFSLLFISLSIFLLAIVFIYPVIAITSSYNNLSTYKGLDGTAYLKNLYPGDYDAINWINKNIDGQPGILEANGDSYTDFGRISVNTGLPTIINWTAHEWLWRGTYDIMPARINDVKTLYETRSPKVAREILSKYNISLVYIGGMEKQKFPNLNETKFQKIGIIIYNKNGVRIYKII